MPFPPVGSEPFIKGVAPKQPGAVVLIELFAMAVFSVITTGADVFTHPFEVTVTEYEPAVETLIEEVS